MILQAFHFLEFVDCIGESSDCGSGTGIRTLLAVFQEEETRELFAVNWSRPYNVFLCDSINAKEIIKSMKREGRNALIIKALKRILTC